MSARIARNRRRGAALISAVAILVVVAAFAAVFLSVHATQVATQEAAIHRLRATAAATAATHLALWKISNDADLQAALARVVYEKDTSFDGPPLFRFDGDLAGATFQVDVWPGRDTVRLQATGISGGAYFERWSHLPLELKQAETPSVNDEMADYRGRQDPPARRPGGRG